MTGEPWSVKKGFQGFGLRLIKSLSLLCPSPTEPEVTIVRGLVNMEAQADEDVEFTCEVSQAGAADVHWHLQGLPLQSNEVTEVAVLGDGRTHVLRLKAVTPEDAGTVSFHVGSHSSSAQLTVRGIWLRGTWPSLTWDETVQAQIILGDDRYSL